MRFSKLLFFSLVLGLASAISLIYFYSIQRNFTQQHKEFLINFNTLENRFRDTTNIILKNSLYVYVNQDEISQANLELTNSYENLIQSKILTKSQYLKVSQNLKTLKSYLDIYTRSTELFLRTNASIKNSLLFLSRHVDNSQILQQHDNQQLIKAIRIVKYFNDAKKLQDFDFIRDRNHLLQSDIQNKNLQKYIKNFNLHSNYLINNYPLFLDSVRKLLENKEIHSESRQIIETFSSIALHDSKELDRFAAILFSAFLISLTTIIILIIKYQKEHKKLEETHSSLKYSLTYDQLTGIYNRRKLETDLSTAQFPVVILIDINDFKYINDIYGIGAGNSLLKDFSLFVTKRVSSLENANTYRLGADEFGILLESKQVETAIKLANKLNTEISQYTFAIDDIVVDIKVNISINNIRPILENANLALKEVKKMNDKNIYLYKNSLNLKENIEENMLIVSLIKDALKNDRIIPYFQPIVDLQASKIVKYEALVRLQLEDGTIMSPYHFLEISKKSSYYHDITTTMIQKVITVAKEYPQYRFSINLSMLDITNKELMKMLFSILEKNQEVAQRIDIELLESEHLEDMEIVKDFINKLHKTGSMILIDDFGTGYSNFSYFSHLNIDIIKIDGSIVSEITKNKRKFHMLKSIKQFANGMNMKTVSEFVETKEIAVLLKDMGAAYGQGYYFSPPLEKPLDNDKVEI